MLRNRVNEGIVKGFKWSFANALANTVDNVFATLIQTGAGMTVNQTGGNLVIATGTTAYSETIIRSKETFDLEGIFRYGLTLSQRIANNNFVVEWVDLLGDGIPFTITNSTTLAVNLKSHGLTSRDIGKGVWIGAITVASCLTQRGTIASITDDNNFVLTVSGFAASGQGTCSLFGFNYHQVIYSGTTATTLGTGYETQRNGYRNTAVNATINTTASGHIGVIETVRFNESTYSDSAFGSSAAQQFVTRATMNQNVPEGGDMYLQIRAFNGSTNPASTTSATFAFVDAQVMNVVPVNLAAMEALSSKNSINVINNSGNPLTVNATGVAAPTVITGQVIPSVSPTTANGATTLVSKLIAAGTTNGTNVKATGGRLVGGTVNNVSAAVKYFKLYNKATAPTVGTDTPIATFGIPANSTLSLLDFCNVFGFAFGSGIGFGTTLLAADADTTAITAGDLLINLTYI